MIATALLLSIKVTANKAVVDEVIHITHSNESDHGDVNVGCPCIDGSGMLASIPSRSCRLSNGEIGVKLTVGVGCVPISYGSSKCLQHDLLYNPFCTVENATKTPIPAYCIRPFCYVDAESCGKNSFERVYRSDYFNIESGIDLYYSYTKCNSMAEDWQQEKLKKGTVKANGPSYGVPCRSIICILQ